MVRDARFMTLFPHSMDQPSSAVKMIRATDKLFQWLSRRWFRDRPHPRAMRILNHTF